MISTSLYPHIISYIPHPTPHTISFPSSYPNPSTFPIFDLAKEPRGKYLWYPSLNIISTSYNILHPILLTLYHSIHPIQIHPPFSPFILIRYPCILWIMKAFLPLPSISFMNYPSISCIFSQHLPYLITLPLVWFILLLCNIALGVPSSYHPISIPLFI